MFFIWFMFAFYMLLKDLYGRNIALYASLFISLSPTFIHYSWEFRPYMFALALCTAQMYAFNRFLRLDTMKYGLWMVALTVGMMYAHFLTALIVFTQILYIAIFDRRRARALIGYGIAIGALCLPLLYYALTVMTKADSFWFKDIGLTSFISTFAYLISPPLDRHTGIVLFPLTFIIIGLIYFHKKLDRRDAQFIMYATVPVITMWLISQAMPFYHHRYFLFGGIGIYALFGVVTHFCEERWPESYIAVLGTLMALTFLTVSAIPAAENTEISSAAIYIEKLNITDFATVHTSQFSQTPFRVYFPDNRAFLLTNFTEEQRFTAGGAVIEDADIIHSLSDVHYNGTLFFVSDVPTGHPLYNANGLWVGRIR
jgi:uncharacterized membrane protein